MYIYVKGEKEEKEKYWTSLPYCPIRSLICVVYIDSNDLSSDPYIYVRTANDSDTDRSWYSAEKRK